MSSLPHAPLRIAVLSIVSALSVGALGTLAACSKGEAPPMQNELRAPGAPVAPVAKGGTADDGVKPVAPKPVPITKGGVADDGVKPVPKPMPLPNTRGGIPDDSIKPAAPAPTPPR